MGKEQKQNSKGTGVLIDTETVEFIRYIQQEWKRDRLYGGSISQPNVIKMLAKEEVKKIEKNKEQKESGNE